MVGVGIGWSSSSPVSTKYIEGNFENQKKKMLYDDQVRDQDRD